MEEFVAWVLDNKTWLFSGVGVAVVGWAARLAYLKRRASSTQSIRSGDSSTNIQAARDVNIGSKEKGNNVGEK